jgi:hypothetical protein
MPGVLSVYFRIGASMVRIGVSMVSMSMSIPEA